MLFSGESWDIPFEDDEFSGYPDLSGITQRLITCMYFALTTLATVGYGDFAPSSVSEKIFGSAI